MPEHDSPRAGAKQIGSPSPHLIDLLFFPLLCLPFIWLSKMHLKPKGKVLCWPSVCVILLKRASLENAVWFQWPAAIWMWQLMIKRSVLTNSSRCCWCYLGRLLAVANKVPIKKKILSVSFLEDYIHLNSPLPWLLSRRFGVVTKMCHGNFSPPSRCHH